MKKTVILLSLAVAGMIGTATAQNPIKRVLLISVDGMHAVDFQNCALTT